jgi:hypothetical protein
VDVLSEGFVGIEREGRRCPHENQAYGEGANEVDSANTHEPLLCRALARTLIREHDACRKSADANAGRSAKKPAKEEYVRDLSWSSERA